MVVVRRVGSVQRTRAAEYARPSRRPAVATAMPQEGCEPKHSENCHVCWLAFTLMAWEKKHEQSVEVCVRLGAKCADWYTRVHRASIAAALRVRIERHSDTVSTTANLLDQSKADMSRTHGSGVRQRGPMHLLTGNWH